ncbi:hypothetical protein WA158_004578 [Blastocystis sp. Blastoise]
MSLSESMPLVNFNVLCEQTLQKYIDYYHIPVSKGNKKDDLAKIVSSHLTQNNVEETTLLHEFVGRLEEYKEEQKKSIEENKRDDAKRRPKRNRRYPIHESNDDSTTEKEEKTVVKEMEVDSDEEKETEEKYCLCNQRSYGLMIECDNPNCPYKWFHYSCVGLPADYQVPETETWFCPECRQKMVQNTEVKN